jgi:hypothetical protein
VLDDKDDERYMKANELSGVDDERKREKETDSDAA